LEKESGKQVKDLKSDNGGEYISKNSKNSAAKKEFEEKS
jgi:hypothetical protein